MLDVDYLRGGPAEHTSDHQHAAQRRGAPAGRGLPGEACSADLPDDVASYIDERVSEGAAGSRAEMIARAVRHERELEILAALRDQGETLYPDLAGLVDWAAERPLDLE